MAIGVGHIRRNAHVDAKRRARGDMLDAALHLKHELGVVPIRAAYQP